jgi:periplasmic divalent cation tolerance protein
MAADALQVVTTTEHKDDALKIAHRLVELRLAACVQIVGPVTSVFRWKGVVEQAQEWQCWAKTLAARYADVETAIREHHPYDEPEVIAVPIAAGSDSYLKWLADEVKG